MNAILIAPGLVLPAGLLLAYVMAKGRPRARAAVVGQLVSGQSVANPELPIRGPFVNRHGGPGPQAPAPPATTGPARV